MKKAKYNIVAIRALVFSILCLVLFVDISIARPMNQKADIRKGCALGIGYFQLNPAMDSNTAWDRVQGAANIVYIQRNWKESKNPDNMAFYDSVAKDVAIARARGLKIYLAFEPLSVTRNELELPSGFSGDFSNTEVQKEYLSLVRRVAENLRPDFFVLNVEINLYKQFNPGDYAVYKDLYPQAYRIVKEASPNTKTSVSISYEDFNGKNHIDESDKAMFGGFVADFAKNSDMLAASVYPFCYANPSAIPDNFLTDLANFSSLPLFVSETGWMSSSFKIGLFTFKSSQDIQAKYIVRLVELVNNTQSKGKEIIAVNYISLVDPDPITSQLIKVMFPALSWYCTLALFDMHGKMKPAYLKMKAWKDGNCSKK